MQEQTEILTKQQKARYLVENPYLVIRELNNRSLFHFVKFFWDVITQDKFVPNWHINLLCKELETIAYRIANGEPNDYDLLINIPPGTTKTVICSIMFPAWCWTKWFWMKFITCSYSQTAAYEAAEFCRDIINSEKFKFIYPEITFKDDKNTKSNYRVVKHFNNNTILGGGRFSTSTGGTLTSFHAHILIWDDPLNPKMAASDVQLAEANKFFEHTLPTRKTNKKVSTTIGIMQRLHENDPSGHLLEKKKLKIKHISLPGQIRDYKETLFPKELEKFYINDLLDVNRLDWEDLERLEEDLGQYNYSGQIGQKPTPPGGGMFRIEHIRVIENISEVNMQMIVRYWDKAGTDEKELTKGKDAAYTVGTKIARLENGKFVVLDVVRGRWDTDKREDIIRETAEADGKNVSVYVEQEPGSGGKDSALATIKNLAGFRADTDPPVGNKIARADTFSVQVNKGNVMIVRAIWNKEYLKELENFPFSRYKDQVDSSSGAFNKLTLKRKARVR